MLAGQLELQMTANLARLASDMNEAKRTVNSAMGNIEKAVAQAKSALGALGIGLSAGMFVSMIKGSIDAADHLNDLSQRIGIGIKDLASWKLAADQSGASIDAVSKGVKGLATYMVENNDKMKRAGITATDANGAMIQLADLFKAMPDGIQKTALAAQLFGKAGLDLLPMLNLGSTGLAEMHEKAAAYGEKMAKLAPDADKFNDETAELALNMRALGINMATYVVGPMTNFAQALNDMATGGERAEKRLQFLADAGHPVARSLMAWSNFAKTFGIGVERSVGYSGPKNAAGLPASEAGQFETALVAYQKEFEARKRAQGLLDKPTASKAGKVGKAAFIGPLWDANDHAAYIASQKAIADAIEASNKALNDQATKLGDQLAAANRALETYGLTEVQILDLTLARLQENMAREEARDADAATLAFYEKEIAALKQIREAKAGLEAKAATKKAIDDQAQEWKRFTDEIDRALTDALMRGFENGKDGGKAFVDSIKNTLKTAAFKIAVSAVVNPIMGAAGSALGLSGGGSGGGLGSASNMLSIGNSASNLMGGAYAAYNTGAYMTLGSMGMEQAAMLAAQDAVFGAAGTAATLEAAGASAFASTIGAALPWIGGAIAVGSMLGLFDGGGEDPHNNAQVNGFELGLSKTGAFAVPNSDSTGMPSSMVAGPTSGAGWWADSVNLSAEQIAAINKQVAATFAQGDALARLLGVDPSVIDGASVDSRFNGTPSNGAIGGYFSSLEQAFTALGDSISVKVIPNLNEFQQTGETLAQTAARIAQEFTLTNRMAVLMGRDPATAFGGSNLKARDALIQSLGGLSGATSVLDSYYKNFHSERERTADTRAGIAATLRAIGISDVPATRDQFRALVEGQDLATEAGRTMYATLLSVAEAFTGITESAEDAARAMGTDRFRTRADYIFAQRTGMMPAYADGGDHDGGWAIVGERGRELAYMPPAHVYSSRDSRALVDLAPVTQAIDDLRADIRAANAAIARASNKTAKILDQWDGDGLPVERVL